MCICVCVKVCVGCVGGVCGVGCGCVGVLGEISNKQIWSVEFSKQMQNFNDTNF